MDGGGTDLDNLLLTCRPHQELVHEFGWTVERGPPDGCATFRKPNGQVYEVGPPALRSRYRFLAESPSRLQIERLRDELPVVGGVAERHLGRLRALEVQVHVVLPGEADAAMHLDAVACCPAVRV